MRLKNTGKRPCAINGNSFAVGEEKDVENVKQSDLVGMTLEVIKEIKEKKSK